MKANAMAFYHKNKERILEMRKKYSAENSKKMAKRRRKYQDEHRAERSAYMKMKKKTDIQYKLRISVRSRLGSALRDSAKGGSAVKDLGCTISELKFYLEGKFKDGMTWKNWSIKGWHIDHVIPLSFYDLSDREQFLAACHYTNLQPMWAVENLKKANKFYQV